MQPRIRWRPLLVLSLCVGLASACDRGTEPTASAPPPAGKANPRSAGSTASAPLRDEIPPEKLDQVMEAHYQGLGHMVRYEYPQAGERFRRVHELAPGWIPGSINLAIALLNQSGSTEAKDKTAGGGSATSNFDEALNLLGDVLTRDPKNLQAHYCRGVILEHLGRLAEAHRDFRFVAETDPNDAYAWLKVGSTLTDPDNPERQAGLKQAKELVEIYTKSFQCNPYLVATLFKLQTAYNWNREPAKQRELFQLWNRMNPRNNVAGPADTADMVYGEMGRYAEVVGPKLPHQNAASPLLSPRFEAPVALKVRLPEGDRWVSESDFKGPLAVIGRARARFGAAVATFDANGDGKLDLYLAAAVLGRSGVRDALLLNQGDGAFEDATVALGLPADRASLGVAASDFDADRRIDLFLTGVGDNRLFRNIGPKGFEDITKSAGLTGPPAVSLTARWVDLDQDGDEDLYVVNYTGIEHAEEAFTDKTPPGIPNSAFRNDGKPEPVSGRPPDNWAPMAVATEDLPATKGLSIALTPWTDVGALLGGDQPHTAMAALDIDDDRDLDLVLLADGAPPVAVLNDRLGQFHTAPLKVPQSSDPIAGLLVTDFDKDDHPDLVAFSPQGRVAPWRNRTQRTAEKTECAFDLWPSGAKNWRSGLGVDFDLDGSPDLLGLPASGPGPEWARNEGSQLDPQPLALGPQSGEPKPLQGLAAADLIGDPLPDLVLVRDGDGPYLARNLGNGNHWLGIDLNGRWKTGKAHMRTNPQASGARIWLEGHGLHVPYDHTTPVAGLAQSVGPIVLGIGKNEAVPIVQIRWPDGVLQCEMNRPADQVITLAEFNRKPDSCPVLFTWNGERFVCIADLLGGGGLGYLIAPGVYNQPDRDESVAIAPDQLRPVDGTYRLSITEPMDEVAYLDHLTLEVVDRPPGVSATPDERFAPGGNRPTGKIIAWSESIEPPRASDLQGTDITKVLRACDRKTADGFRRLDGWIGYAEEHGIVLDFGDRLSGFGPNDPLVLCLAGWVEYPHSHTNYAAATAGVRLQPPVLERQRDDGTWDLLESDPGYPAGMPRLTTLELTGKLGGPRCVLRLRTNMECYWDQAFIAVRDPKAEVRVTSLPVARAVLGYRGYTREVSPDGRRPLLYDYDYIDPAPLARLEGRLTRYGDVVPLLREDDDHLCLIGPGDEVRLEFDAKLTPDLPEGWTRSYVLRAIGYCKDADPFTATSDSVEPLPWRGMPAFPFGPEGKRPEDPAYREYLRAYQTRVVGGH